MYRENKNFIENIERKIETIFDNIEFKMHTGLFILTSIMMFIITNILIYINIVDERNRAFIIWFIDMLSIFSIYSIYKNVDKIEIYKNNILINMIIFTLEIVIIYSTVIFHISNIYMGILLSILVILFGINFTMENKRC